LGTKNAKNDFCAYLREKWIVLHVYILMPHMPQLQF